MIVSMAWPGANWFLSTPPHSEPAPCPSGFYPRPPRGGRPHADGPSRHDERVSIHAPRAGGDCGVGVDFLAAEAFLSTPPARGATPDRGAGGGARRRIVSIHAPRAGGDAGDWGDRFGQWKFLSTPPARGATNEHPFGDFPNVSIHAPRAGGDLLLPCVVLRVDVVSIHAPRAGGDVEAFATLQAANVFLSTPPARGATMCAAELAATCGCRFYPRPPRGGRRAERARARAATPVSIHAPRAGGDVRALLRLLRAARDVSIHAPRAGGDLLRLRRPRPVEMFLSTPPARGATPCWAHPDRPAVFLSTPPARGATRNSRTLPSRNPAFLSTPPARGATRCRARCSPTGSVSIHAPRAGGDGRAFGTHLDTRRFYPRPPRGGRPGASASMSARRTSTFLSTPPARGATCWTTRASYRKIVSIHAPRAGGDRLFRGAKR